MGGEVEVRLKGLLLEKARELGIEIAKMEVMPDHVHLFVKASSVFATHHTATYLKGYSPKMLTSEFASLKSRLSTLWSQSYFCEIIGSISEEKIKQYIENQKNV